MCKSNYSLLNWFKAIKNKPEKYNFVFAMTQHLFACCNVWQLISGGDAWQRLNNYNFWFIRFLKSSSKF